MKSLIFKNYVSNIFQNVVMVIQLVVLLVLFNSAISGFVYDGKISNYIDKYDSTSIFLSGAVENNISANASEQFIEFISDLKSIDGVQDVGYSIEESSIIKNNDNAIIKTIYLNPCMSKIKYPLSYGKWFGDNNNENDIEIIIGGELNRQYDVGDKIILSRVYYDNGMQTKDFNAVIIGKLKNPAFVMDLNYSSNRPLLQNLFEDENNIILTNNYNIVDESNLYFPLGSLLIDTESNISNNSIKKLEQYGNCHSLDEIQTNSIDVMKKSIRESLPPVIILLVSILFGFVGFTYLYTYKFMKKLSILYLCGMSKNGLNLIVISQSLLSCIFSIISLFVVKNIPYLNELFFRRSLWGVWNYVLCLGIIILVLFITFISSKIMLRKTPLEVLRRYE